MEAFYITGGQAEFSDNEETVTLVPGDTALTQSGEAHSIKNAGDIPLELVALILFQ